MGHLISKPNFQISNPFPSPANFSQVPNKNQIRDYKFLSPHLAPIRWFDLNPNINYTPGFMSWTKKKPCIVMCWRIISSGLRWLSVFQSSNKEVAITSWILGKQKTELVSWEIKMNNPPINNVPCLFLPEWKVMPLLVAIWINKNLCRPLLVAIWINSLYLFWIF